MRWLDRATATRWLMGILALRLQRRLAAAVIREALDGGADGAVDDEFDSLDEDSLLP